MNQQRVALRGQISDIDLRLLRIYKSVVECGGFSAAEVELNISRAAISIAMSDLEKRLSLRLCQRGRSGFSLTDEGRQVYESTLQLLTSLEDFRTQVNTIHSRLKGELNIGITDNLVTMPRMQITNALAKLKQRGPDVRINIRMIPPKEVEMGVLDGQLHIGAVPNIRPLQGLEYHPLYEEQSLLYCRRGHPLADIEDEAQLAKAVSNYDAVIPAYEQLPEIKELQTRLRATATATDREGIAFLILTGEYIGFLPEHFAQRWVEEGQLCALAPNQLRYTTPFVAITRKGARPNLVLQTYLEELQQSEND